MAKLTDVADCSAVTAKDLAGITDSLVLERKGITGLKSGDFQGLVYLEELHINENDQLTYYGKLKELPGGVFDGLTNLKSLSLRDNGLTALPNGVFNGLSNLEYLNLAVNDLTALPDGVFDGLANLESLSVGNNDLTSLPDGVFDGLTNLDKLWLYRNALTALPAGVFDGLSRLTWMALVPNPGAPFTLTAELEQQGDDAVVVKVAEGTPVDMSITLSAQGGTLSSTTVTIEGGSLKSEAVTVTPSGEGHVTVTVESASFEIPSSYNYDFSGIQTGLGPPLIMGSAPPPGSATPEPEPNKSGPTAAVSLSPPTALVGTAIALTMSFANLESDSDTSDTDYIFRADVVNADGCEGGGMGIDRYMYKVDEDPETRTGTISAACPSGDYTVEVSISSPGNVELASATADFTVAAPAEQQQPHSTDATLSSLALRGIGYVLFGSGTFASFSVANGVTQTTVTPTTNDDGATYVIKRGGVADADGVIPLAVGENVITIEVTSEDGQVTKTYAVTVTRAAPPRSNRRHAERVS